MQQKLETELCLVLDPVSTYGAQGITIKKREFTEYLIVLST